MMHEHSTSLMVTARMKGLLHVAKKVSAVDSIICNVAWLTVPVLKSLVTWTDLFNVMANSDGHMSIRTERMLSSVHASSVYIFCRAHGEQNGVQYPRWLCMTGPLQLAKLTVRLCCT